MSDMAGRRQKKLDRPIYFNCFSLRWDAVETGEHGGYTWDMARVTSLTCLKSSKISGKNSQPQMFGVKSVMKYTCIHMIHIIQLFAHDIGLNP